MTELTTIVDDQIWATERPIWFSGVRLRARTSVVKLGDGGLLVHSPAPLSDELKAQIAQRGAVRWLVIPNCFHHLGTPAAAAAFPDAKVVGPASAGPKNPDLTLHHELAALGALVPEVETLPLAGVPFLDETVLYHRPTQTLLGADLILCAGAKDHWTWRWAARVVGCYERLRVPPDVKKKIPDKAAAARAIAAILQRPARRLIVAHADVVGEDWRARLDEAWRLVGVDHSSST